MVKKNSGAPFLYFIKIILGGMLSLAKKEGGQNREA